MMVHKIFLLTALMISLITASVAYAESDRKDDSGIYGHTLLGPTCPLQRPGDDNCKDVPYEAAMLVKAEDQSKEVIQFKSNNQGEFRVALPPGNYQVEPAAKNGMSLPYASVQTAIVKPHAYTPIDIQFDSGIRR